MFILVVGLNHRTAPVEIRERITYPEHVLPKALAQLKLKQRVEACAILSTCNRVEVYAAVTDVEIGLQGIKEFLSETSGLPQDEIRDYLYVHTLYDAVRHLFRVVAGLDSMVLGETQILGQVRQAFQIAFENGVTNTVLNSAFKQAITVGKRVRTDTFIDRHAVSISYAAVELAKQTFGDLEGKSVLIVGAGKMSELTLLHMVSNGVKTVLVSNRSYDHAEELAQKFGGTAIRFDEFYKQMEHADIVVSCTGAPVHVIKADLIRPLIEKRNGKPIFLIDIAVPRDIEPEVGNIEGVQLFDIDDLKNVIDKNLEERKKEAVKAEVIIEEEIDEFFKWLGARFAVPTIKALKDKASAIVDVELERSLCRLGPITEKQQKIITSLVNTVVNQLLHEPIVNLKEYATTHQGHLYTEILQNLFNLDVKGQRPKMPMPVGEAHQAGHPEAN